MQSVVSIRFVAAVGFAFSALLAAQTSAPVQAKPSAAVPSQSSIPATALTTPPPPATPAQLPPKRAEITYADDTLSVSASNSSLNQILREISRKTGIKISGGVADERVFGQYGPDAPAQILAALLDGTGSNLLLVHGAGATPTELILTPRNGGPTPPNPNARSFDDGSESRNQPPVQTPEPQPAAQPVPDQSQPVNPPATTPVTPATGSDASPDATQQSPNGTKTPQEIYDQLQKLRQQQQQQQQPNQ